MRQAFKPATLRASRLRAVETVNAIVKEYQAQGFRLTLRQLYYQHVARGLIPNTMREYKKLGDVVNEGRLQGLIDWAAIEDRTRELTTVTAWSSPADIVSACASQFKYDLWDHQPVRVEVWVEKEALAGVIESACADLRVPYLSCRGYTSQSEMYLAGMRLKRWVEHFGQDVVILHFGDHDPSGIDMSRDIRDRLALFMGDHWARVSFNRLALNMDQVTEYQPPPNPAKTTDSRFAAYIREYGRESWELDALEPRVIRALVQRAVEAHVDRQAWTRDQDREAAARASLHNVSVRWNDVVDFVGKGGE